ncbi:hypothetical protein NADFUDRAFT_74035 [Nadsonia fulvescens var. elongata DSM 6958]|uniref:DNA mismatch repair proteins mutS family domain-containing protein n=1 Tax=Nadsonia fulvescens var. elongata DSM 6958 TaxID=857566 RepID=A0A1E3PJK0_9ASCO|nr:hypothetical protein NADFUDRAFT_74035 [Nadsonia fulvescens var. elongata DSM 6958]
MWNTVVFFKKGKFYELYERDADIAHSQFDLKLAGGGRANMRLAGIPEMSFDFWAASFIAKGHNVARVDQKESALAKEMRENTNGGKKEDKVIRRELTCVLTSATLTDESMLTDDLSTYCMSVKQVESFDEPTRFAVCFVDTATATFNISEFTDDKEYTKFETLIAQIRPRELLLEKGKITKQAVRIIKNNTGHNTLWNYLNSGLEFWDADTAIEECARGGYFQAENLDDITHYPVVLKSIIERQPLAMSAFGAMLWYLKFLKIDGNLISLGNFSIYDSIRRASSLVLDGQSLKNLEIFANTFDGSDQGTVFKLLDRCITPFGKRLLRNWVCHPLIHVDRINARLDAVDHLIQNYALQQIIEAKISRLPDLERLLSRIHAGQIKVKDFVRVIEGFECIYELLIQIKTPSEVELKGLLLQLIDSFPNLELLLSEWSEAFDRLKAKDEGVLVPEQGVDEEFDMSVTKMENIEKELHVLLASYKKEFKSHEICFRDSGKEVFLIEVPVRIKSVPKSWQVMSSTVKVKRYWSPEVRTLVRSLLEARESHKIIAERVTGHIYARFDNDYENWLKAVLIIGNMDCLVSLARTSAALGSTSCRPEFLNDVRSQLDFQELRHPCFNSRSTEFIPNDINLGGNRASLSLLTGANAAGKSTVLRMTCVAVIMAQIGCYVPSRRARLTPVDRIMTRLGANDNIFAGKSTFYVELSETKRILSEATNRSLVVLDELGRGGSTSDGFAIAEAVLHHLATYVGSLGFFATHYGTLWSSFKAHPEVTPMRMAIMVDDASRRVTFLYKLEPGTSPGSFGMHVATMCGIGEEIVTKANTAAQNFEHTARMKRQLDLAQMDNYIPLGLTSDFSWVLKNGLKSIDDEDKHRIRYSLINFDRLALTYSKHACAVRSGFSNCQTTICSSKGAIQGPAFKLNSVAKALPFSNDLRAQELAKSRVSIQANIV